jgi:hypothetical protein
LSSNELAILTMITVFDFNLAYFLCIERVAAGYNEHEHARAVRHALHTFKIRDYSCFFPNILGKFLKGNEVR